MVRHDIHHDTSRTGSNGNMHTATPICSCGWRGYPVADYNDDQVHQLNRQVSQHLKDAARQNESVGNTSL